MLPRALVSTFMVLSTLVAFGCGPDCRLMCEEQEEAACFGASDVPDCESQCKHTEDLVRNAECESDWDEYLACLDDLDNICDAVQEICDIGESCSDPKCDNEADDLLDCFADYCQEHPRNNECEALLGTAL